MNTIPPNLCTLVEQLADARQFHDGSALQSAGDQRERHRERALGNAAMLSEIRRWESVASGHNELSDSRAAGDGLDRSVPDDSCPALMSRISRLHCEMRPIKPSIRMRATGNATDGEAMEGRRSAG